jgi:ubiquinone/menaquinone biosynthesis C-methylase UbiE
MLKTGHEMPDAEIRSRYERLTGRGGLGPEFNARVLALAGDLTGRRVLDVGCGQGELLRGAGARFECARTGVDFAVTRLSAAMDGARPIRLVAHDLARPLPFADGAFDVVFCTETLEHLKGPAACLAEIRRVLAPGGRLIVSVPNATGFFPFNRLGWLVPGHWLRSRLLPYEHPDNTDQPIDTSFNYREIMNLLRGAGFEVEAATGYRYLRYLQMLPGIRSAYAIVYPAVERWLPRVSGQRLAYNVILRCRRSEAHP